MSKEQKKKTVDYGHYVPIPLPEGGEEGVAVLEAGRSLSLLHVVGMTPGDLPRRFVLREGASLEVSVFSFPGTSAPLPFEIDLAGEGAQVTLCGLCLCKGEDKVVVNTSVRHLSPCCQSQQNFYTIASGHSDVAFNGRIVVAPDAQKTEAYQTNRNILLSEDATIGSTPQLEIYADDVKCSHGATAGSLDEEAQFYMRSRGIPLLEAKVLQMLSFASPSLSLIRDEEKREELSGMIEKAIRDLQ